LKGARLTQELGEGKALSWDVISLPDPVLPLGARVPRGLRAYSLNPSNRLEVGPRDYVDIMFNPRGSDDFPAVVVEGARVLAVDPRKEPFEVVVAVTRHDIQLMEKALQKGTLKIALRNSQEIFSRHSNPGGRLFHGRKSRTIPVWSEVE
jgi:Flp pilus assembly protein CpaB